MAIDWLAKLNLLSSLLLLFRYGISFSTQSIIYIYIYINIQKYIVEIHTSNIILYKYIYTFCINIPGGGC